MFADKKRYDGLLKQSCERFIAYCGTITYGKDGVDDLIKAFQIVHQTEDNIKLYIIGPFLDEETSVKCKELVARLQLSDWVVFKGVIPYTQLPQMLVNSELLLLARPDNIQAKYGFPTKLGEYLLTGNPVVVTDVGNIKDFLKDGQSAYITTPNNYQDFASKIIEAFLDYPHSLSIGDEGRRVALLHFNNVRETNKIVKVLNK